MPPATTLDEILGRSRVDEPQRHRNSDGAVVAITFTQEAWDSADSRLKSERGTQRSFVTACPVRGLVSVDAYVVPANSAAAPKPWSRVRGHAASGRTV